MVRGPETPIGKRGQGQCYPDEQSQRPLGVALSGVRLYKAEYSPSPQKSTKSSQGAWLVREGVVCRQALRGRGLPRPGEAAARSARSGESTRKRSRQSSGACEGQGAGCQRSWAALRPPRTIPVPKPAPQASQPLDGRTSRDGRSRGWAPLAATDSARQWHPAVSWSQPPPRPRPLRAPGAAASPCSLQQASWITRQVPAPITAAQVQQPITVPAKPHTRLPPTL